MLIRKYLLISFVLVTLFICNINCTNSNNEEKTTTETDKKAPQLTTSEPENGHVLKGTSILSASEKNMESRLVYGLGLDSVVFTDCQGPPTETPAPTRIADIKKLNDSTLIIATNFSANCAYDFLAEIEVVSNNTLNLIYHGYGGYAVCDCCFGLTYIISLTKEEDYDLNNLKFVTINGYAKTRIPIQVGKNLVSH